MKRQAWRLLPSCAQPASVLRPSERARLRSTARGCSAGDLKPLNAVRVAAKGGELWKLIDLDAAARIGVGHLGLKSSTVYAPPELFYKRKQAASAAAESGAAEAEVPSDGGYSVRAVSETGDAVDATQASAFEPLVASASFDMWSFGCVLYEARRTPPLLIAGRDAALVEAKRRADACGRRPPRSC